MEVGRERRWLEVGRERREGGEEVIGSEEVEEIFGWGRGKRDVGSGKG